MILEYRDGRRVIKDFTGVYKKYIVPTQHPCGRFTETTFFLSYAENGNFVYVEGKTEDVTEEYLTRVKYT